MQKYLITLALFTIAVSAQVYQDIEGFNNGNGLGAHALEQPRLGPSDYEDGTDEPRGGGFTMPLRLPSARLISNVVAGGVQNDAARPISDWHTFWGQFLDHDFTLIEEAIDEPFDIVVPDDDMVFVPGSNQTFFRSPFIRGANGTREFINELTSYVDASNVYGAEDERAAGLRSMMGGRLIVNADEPLLPPLIDEVDGAAVPMASLGIAGATLYAAGDVRANENAALLAVHTLWVREHNRQADAFAADSNGPCQPDNTDECLYQEARRRVIALHQVVFENEYSELLFANTGNGLGVYGGYDAAVSAAVTGEFSIVFRYGHSELNDMIMRDDLAGQTFPALSLNQVFFNPMVNEAIDVDTMLSGFTRQLQREIDAQTVDAVRNTLFMEAMADTQAMDLVARNIQRARDHGVPSLNDVRRNLGLAAYDMFDFCLVQSDCDNLSTAYNGTVEDIDLWIGAVAEDHIAGSAFGSTLDRIIGDQYNALRDGDEFWFRNLQSPNPFSAAEISELDMTLLSDVIFRNSDNIQTLPCNVMQFQTGPTCMNPNGASTLVASVVASVAALALLF